MAVSTFLGGLAQIKLSSVLNIILAAFAGLFFLFLGFYFYVTPTILKDRRRWYLPPGPRGLPFIGSLLDFNDSEEVRNKAVEWKNKYGDVFYTRIGVS